MRAGHAQLVLAHLVEDACAVAENYGRRGGGVPYHVAKAAQAGEVGVDRVPIGVQRHILRSADGEQTLRRLGNCAGVGDVELQRCAGRERGGEFDCGLVKLAGVIGVGVERGDGVESVRGGDADALPVQRRGDFKRDFGQRGFAVVAHGDEGAHGDFMFRGAQMHVHVEFGEGQGLALGVAGGWRFDRLTAGGRLLRAGTDRGRGLAIFVGGARKNDLAVVRRVWLRLILRSSGSGLRRSRERGEKKEAREKELQGAGSFPPFRRKAGERMGQPTRFADAINLHEPRPFCFCGLPLRVAPLRGAASWTSAVGVKAAARRWRAAS